ncbi:HAD superfamily hydrolase (TIGR01459 family) [Roseibium hamelinense]|uniref:HAD superfamily hydrolase (TIGR01459 family) n=1 Tax=Roseibium hamelinense TaxID=150831 RepID=A0A562T2Q6_9HYPH|nr:TIGR01459 family HAD-type hydrolase [Roseibium hamelinense]MTI43388.1 TIGR01459 family HAD-type hydrolase [Roseibium hamelinense]TWI87588.1 HAD superfamily hydrolase (TIGR01459 family) [Roseibium hamelinense]
MTATAPLIVPGLRALAPDYAAVLCDVWGVLHNGVKAFENAHKALTQYRAETNGTVVLITNAPRPAHLIKEQLARFGVPNTAYDDVVTSGDVTRELLSSHAGNPILHIGPERDFPIYDDMDIVIGTEENAQVISCTGLFDDETETPDDYRSRFEDLVARGLEMICANPDIVVERGDRLIWCAGALARLYEDIGGRVTILGKPHKPIYDAAIRKVAEIRGTDISRDGILAIGDGLPTDIRGAVSQDLDVLFITAGIHSADFGAVDSPEEQLIRARLVEEGLKARAAVPRLVW